LGNDACRVLADYRADGLVLVKNIRGIMKFNDLPDTITSLTLYISYAADQIKRNFAHNRKLEKQITECERRLSVKQKGENP